MEEIEVKFLDIDPGAIEKKLKNLGAKKVFDRLFKIKIFDYPDLRLNEKAAWLRLRDEGDQVTLSFKQRLGIKDHKGKTNDQGMKELEVIVEDFETVSEILLNAGLTQKFYEEKRRIRYLLDGVEVDIDYVPELDPYLEIEAKSHEEIDKTIDKLGLDPKDRKVFSTFQIYQLKGINMLDYSEFRFSGLVKK